MKNLKTFNEFVNENSNIEERIMNRMEIDVDDLFNEFDEKLKDKSLYTNFDKNSTDEFNIKWNELKDDILNLKNHKGNVMNKIFGDFKEFASTHLNKKGIDIIEDFENEIEIAIGL